MSIDFKSVIGIGYIISNEEYKTLRESAKDRFIEIEDEFHYIDTYRKTPLHFFGEILSTVEPGEFVSFSEIVSDSSFNVEAFSTKYLKIFEICGIDFKPDSKWAIPKFYLINIIS
jgi:hypothetical protein